MAIHSFTGVFYTQVATDTRVPVNTNDRISESRIKDFIMINTPTCFE